MTDPQHPRSIPLTDPPGTLSKRLEDERYRLPLPNYTLSTACPACGMNTIRRACKVRCERCGFMWDCSEL